MRMSEERLLPGMLRLRGRNASMTFNHGSKFRSYVVAQQGKLAGRDITDDDVDTFFNAALPECGRGETCAPLLQRQTDTRRVKSSASAAAVPACAAAAR